MGAVLSGEGAILLLHLLSLDWLYRLPQQQNVAEMPCWDLQDQISGNLAAPTWASWNTRSEGSQPSVKSRLT